MINHDGPEHGMHCALAIGVAVRSLGIEIRSGLHYGKTEVGEGDLHGMTVHIAARLASAADAGEVFVSSVVRDLAAESGLRFASRGKRLLRGVPGEWEIFAVRSGLELSRVG